MRIAHGRHGQFIVPDQDTSVCRSLLELEEYSEREVEVFKALINLQNRVLEIGAKF